MLICAYFKQQFELGVCIFRNAAILAPLNATVDGINAEIISRAPGDSKIYMSTDTPLSDEDAVKFPVEFLNKQESGSLPPHKLELKVGSPIIVIRNIHPPHLVNGTRATITNLLPNVIEAVLPNGRSHFIPRISITPSDNSREFIFKRRQFPIKVAYCMTINRAEGQTLDKTGICLSTPCFGHGQLYVGISRTPDPTNIHIHLPSGGRTLNPVFKECL